MHVLEKRNGHSAFQSKQSGKTKKDDSTLEKRIDVVSVFLKKYLAFWAGFFPLKYKNFD